MRFKRFLFVGVLLGILFSFSAAFAVVGLNEKPEKHVAGEIIIGFHPTANYFEMAKAVSSVGGKVIGKHDSSQLRARRLRLGSTDPSAIDEAIQSLKSNPAFAGKIKFVEPNMVRKVHGSRSPTGDVGVFSQSGDPLLHYQWGYYDIGANYISAPTTTTGVLVAVIDTGVDYNHPDLIGKVTKGKDFVNMDSDPMDDYGHGTHVSGVIAAKPNNAYGMVGVSFNAKILAIKALAASGYGNSWDIYWAIRAAADNSSVKVINMSLGGGYSSFEEEAVRYAVLIKGKLIVASAGNDDTNVKSYPAGFADPVAYPDLYQGVIAVAAHDISHCRAIWGPGSASNYGPWVSISAPGDGIFSTLPTWMFTNGFDWWSGTSMAAPHVSGAAALAWQQNPGAAYWQIYTHVVYHNSSPLDTLDRTTPGCWPNDGSTFQRLDVLHILEWQYYEVCDNKGGIWGYAFDAQTGLPLAGGKVSAKQGTTLTGLEYVPFFGEITYMDTDEIVESGPGLFRVTTPVGLHNLTLEKKNYTKTIPKNQYGVVDQFNVTACTRTYAGNIPVPPAQGTYWLVVTWEPGFTDTYFDSALEVWDYDEYWDTYYYDNPGILSLWPYVNHIWDSDWGMGDLRDYAETIRIWKTSTGTSYFFYVEAGTLNPWEVSGIKAYLFKGTNLIKTYTPPPGSSGNVWLICDIYGTTIEDYNYVDTF
jgi:thermitase